MTKYKLYYIDSKGDKRYLYRTEGVGVWETDSEDVVLVRRWAEARQGMLLQIEGIVNPEREDFVNQWCEIHR